MSKNRIPFSRQLRARASICAAANVIHHGQMAVLGGHGVVHDGERQVGPAHFAPRHLEAGKSLRRGGLVDEVAVNIDDRRLARLLGNQVGLPDFFVQSSSRHKF